MAKKLDPIEKARRATERKAKSDEKKRLYREGVERRAAERLAKRIAKEEALVAARLARAQQREREYNEQLDIIYDMCLAVRNRKLTEYGRRKAGRMIGTLIFELPFRFIGWKSKSYMEARTFKKMTDGTTLAPTHEHVYPRQFDGEFLLCHMQTMGGMSRETFSKYIDIFRQTAHVLKQENMNLEQYQKAHRFISPEAAYLAAGVEVVQCEGGQTFHRLEEVAPQKVLHAFFGYRNHIEDK